jgi:hypothetical protein
MTWGYEVPGMILMQACLYTYSLLGGVTFKVLPWAAKHLAQQCCHRWKHFWNFCCVIAMLLSLFFLLSSIFWNLCPFKANFISRNSLKSFRAKSGEQDGCSISGINFWAQNCLTECILWNEKLSWSRMQVWAKVHAFFCAQLHVTVSVFPWNKLGWPFGLVKWIKSEQYPSYQRNSWALSSFVILTFPHTHYAL